MQPTGKISSRRCRRKNDRVENNRIRKLLASEYKEFSESILVESPFAETTRAGNGVREVALALTSSKLIVAADVFQKNSGFFCPRGLDPSIETFELISVYPLEYVSLSVFRRRHRRTLKARFIDGSTKYYELGGMQGRKIHWQKWRENVKELIAKKTDGSSLSETTVGSSSSNSTLYVLSSEIEIQNGLGKNRKKAICRVWTHYGGAGDFAHPTWSQKDLYLGPSHNELVSGQYTPVPIRFAGASLEDIRNELIDHSPITEKPCKSWPSCKRVDSKNHLRDIGGLCDVLFIRDRRCVVNNLFTACHGSPCNHCRLVIYDNDKLQQQSLWITEDTFRNYVKESENLNGNQKSYSKKSNLARKISRFGFGVPEKCNSGLVLGPCRGDRDYCDKLRSNCALINAFDLMESAVRIWENDGEKPCKSSRKRLRRYGLSASAHFLHSLGPWCIQPGERDSIQGRRSFSMVNICRQPIDPELRLPVSRKQLTTSISCTALNPEKFGAIATATRGRVVLFWTPEYWYRPRPAITAYRELRQHLDLLRTFRQEKERQTKRKLFYKRKKYAQNEGKSVPSTIDARPSSLLGRIFSGNNENKRKRKFYESQENSTTVHLRRLLRMDFRITVWDLDSSTLAAQLTLVDRDLFVRIPAEEIRILIYQKASKNAPNIGAWIAFSHRMSCLAVSEIIAIKNLAMRARIVARFINVANKCFAMGNFHSCRSILAGLQAPPIYRLKKTWSYLRVHHANRYEIMEKLCKTYKNPRTPTYQRAWSKAERNPPYIPYVGHLLTMTLDLTDNKSPKKSVKIEQRKKNISHYSLRKSSTQTTNKPQSSFERKTNIAPPEAKQRFGKRILTAALQKMRFKTNRKPSLEEETNLLWTSREQALGKEYFYRWNNIVLERRLRVKEEERSRNMDPRKKRVFEVASWLTDCQSHAQGYRFPVHSFACEFLLKARYREDRENFFISLKLEPPKVT